MGKIANELQNWYLETKDFLLSEQAGFWQFCSTEDLATYLFQDTEDTFQEQKLEVGPSIHDWPKKKTVW